MYEIRNEKCLETMRKISDNTVDLIVTSPPYNKGGGSQKRKESSTSWKGAQQGNIIYDSFGDDLSQEKYFSWQIEVINEAMRILKPTGSMFYNHKNQTRNNEVLSPLRWIFQSKAVLRQEIVWVSGSFIEIDRVKFLPNTERIYWLTKIKAKPKFNGALASLPDVWNIAPPRGKSRNNHPAPFPIEIPKRCIKACTDEGDLVYDPYTGSGITAVAALNLGRRFVGSEISIQYIEIAEKRISRETGQGSLFEK